MQICNLKIGSYKLQMDVELRNEGVYREVLSEEYLMEGIVQFQMRAIISEQKQIVNKRRNSNYSEVWIFGKFVNVLKTTSIYIKFSSTLLEVNDMCILADSKWHLIPDTFVETFQFDLNFTVEIESNSINKLKILYDDVLTDFELRGNDGSVRVHKCILAATSPVFQTMLQGDWRETNTGYVNLEGMSKAILQDFKTFIYLNTLPPTVSEQILIIAMRYDIPDMESICIKNLIQNMKAENLNDLLKFAVTHNNERLSEAILECVQYGFIKVDQIRNHRIGGNNNDTSQEKTT